MMSELSLLQCAFTISFNALLSLISLMFTAMLSSKYDSNENPMMNMGSIPLYLMHISQKLGRSLKIFMNSESFILTFLIRLRNFLLLG